MVTLLLPAAVSASFLSLCCGCVGARYTHIDCHGTAQFGQMTTLGGGVIALLSVIAIGVIWIVAVSPVDMVWSVAGMRGVGRFDWLRHKRAAFARIHLWPRCPCAARCCRMACRDNQRGSRNVGMDCDIHPRPSPPSRSTPSIRKTNRYSCSLTVLSLRCMSTYF